MKISCARSSGTLVAEALLELGQQLDPLHRVEAEVELEVGVGAAPPRPSGARRRDHVGGRGRVRIVQPGLLAGGDAAPCTAGARSACSARRRSISCRFSFPVVVRGSGSNQTS